MDCRGRAERGSDAKNRFDVHNRFATKTYVDIASSESSSSEFTPSFSLYRFVVSRSRGGSHSPILLEPPRLTNAPPAPAVKEPLRGLLKTGRRLPGYPIISTEFPQAGACRRTDKALRACGLGWPASPTARHSWHRDCRLHYQAVPPCEKPRAPPLRTRSGCS